MKRLVGVAFLIVFACWRPGSGDDLPSAVQAVAEQNGALRSSESAVAAARAQLSAARSARYPRLSIRSAYTRGDGPVYAFSSLLGQRSFRAANFAVDSLNHPGYVTNVENALDVRVPLFTAFETSSEISTRETAYEQACNRRTVSEQSVRLQAVGAYLQALLKADIVRNLDDRIASSEREVENARKLNARGLVLGSDFFAAQAILSNLKAQRSQTEGERSEAVARLAIMMGRSSSSVETNGRLNATVYGVADQNELQRQALASRRELRVSALRVSMAHTGATRADRSFLPTIEAFAALETNTHDFGSNPTERLVGVTSVFPLGDPVYVSRVKAARADVEAARADEASSEEAVRLDVIQAYAAYAAAVSALPFVQQTADQARKSLALARPLYREGRQSILDVLRAEEALYRADRMLSETAHQIHVSYARLMWSVGALDSDSVQRVAAAIGETP